MFDAEQPAAFIRYPGQVPVRYRPYRVNGDGGKVQPTPGGICFPCGEPLEPGALVELSLAAPHGVEHFVVEIAWCRPDGVEFLAGARMLDDADACRARLVAQLCHIDLYRRQELAKGRELDADRAASEWIARYAHQVPAIT
jgi:hypothetical protein